MKKNDKTGNKKPETKTFKGNTGIVKGPNLDGPPVSDEEIAKEEEGKKFPAMETEKIIDTATKAAAAAKTAEKTAAKAKAEEEVAKAKATEEAAKAKEAKKTATKAAAAAKATEEAAAKAKAEEEVAKAKAAEEAAKAKEAKKTAAKAAAAAKATEEAAAKVKAEEEPEVEEDPEEALPDPPPPPPNEDGYSKGIIQGVVIILAILAFIAGYYTFYPMGKADGEKTATARSMEKTANSVKGSARDIKDAADKFVKTAKSLPAIKTSVDANGKMTKAGLKAINKNVINSIKKMDLDHKKILKGQKKLSKKIGKFKVAKIICPKIKMKKVRSSERNYFETTITDENGKVTVERDYY